MKIFSFTSHSISLWSKALNRKGLTSVDVSLIYPHLFFSCTSRLLFSSLLFSSLLFSSLLFSSLLFSSLLFSSLLFSLVVFVQYCYWWGFHKFNHCNLNYFVARKKYKFSYLVESNLLCHEYHALIIWISLIRGLN